MSRIIVNTIVVEAAFEWGASPALKHVRGADSFRGSPWYSYIRYRGSGGEV